MQQQSSIDGTECRRKVANGKNVAGTISAKSLQLECAIVLHKVSFVAVLMYESERMVWREKQKSNLYRRTT